MADKQRREPFRDEDEAGTSNNSKREDRSRNIKNDIEKLARKGFPLSPSDLADLYHKYPNDETVVDELINLRSKRYRRIKEYARKAAKKIHDRYASGDKPLHEILNKMMSFKTKHKWSDTEYDEFRKELTSLLSGNRAREVDYNQNIRTNRSRINRAIGTSTVIQERGLRITQEEHGTLNEILAMYERTLSLHKSVFMHSLMYQDCSIVAMTGKFDRSKHIASNHIHPLIAAMFLPRFELFDIHMLHSNFGSIIKNRYEKRPIVTEADALLFYDITSDPNDVVCDINSPMADLRNRYKVQIQLWETVLKLRNGNYYEASPIGEFITALNSCRNNLYDNADLAYNHDEGAMMRRLLSVFSLRPTFVASKPLASLSPLMGQMQIGLSMNGMNNNLGFQSGTIGPMGMMVGGDHGLNHFPFSQQPVTTVTSIPMIVVQIPQYSEGAEPKDLRAATSQTLWVNEHNSIVPKEKTIIYSKEVLIFYVNRRSQSLRIRTFTNPLSFSQLPLAMSNFERLNPYPINVPASISLGRVEETFQLRSVVTVTESQIRQTDSATTVITGSNALIMKHRDFSQVTFDPNYYLYDPFGASLPVLHPEAANSEEHRGYFTNKPISGIEPYYSPDPKLTGGVPQKSFFDRASSTGTIYIYAKPVGYNPRESIIV